MTTVVTMVSGTIAAERVAEVKEQYQTATSLGLPAGMERTFLLRAEESRVAILSVWRDRGAVDAMIASGEEPLARRLIREAGGEPEPVFWEALASA